MTDGVGVGVTAWCNYNESGPAGKLCIPVELAVYSSSISQTNQ